MTPAVLGGKRKIDAGVPSMLSASVVGVSRLARESVYFYSTRTVNGHTDTVASRKEVNNDRSEIERGRRDRRVFWRECVTRKNVKAL